MSLTIYQGSILDCDVDVIVNPANSFLDHGGGLARVIDGCARGDYDNGIVRADWGDLTSKAPGWLEYRAAVDAYYVWTDEQSLVATGAAVLGPPGALCRRFKGIIHAVGPVWGGGGFYEKDLLESVYDAALLEAEKAGFESIAFPAISAGLFGAPIEVVARQAVGTCVYSALDVTFALMDDAHVVAFEGACAYWHMHFESSGVTLPALGC